MKFTKCPKCGSRHLTDRWKKNRKLQQSCDECKWQSPIRTPEIIKIETIKRVIVNQFNGFCYEVFDKYGHIMTYSRSYNKKKEAEFYLFQEMTRGKEDRDAGPYTGILWPDVVCVKGEVFGMDKLKRERGSDEKILL